MPEGEFPESGRAQMRGRKGKRFSRLPSICYETRKEKKINFGFAGAANQKGFESDDEMKEKTSRFMENFHFIQTLFHIPAFWGAKELSQRKFVAGAIQRGSKGKFPIIKASTSHSLFRLRSRKLFLMRKWFLIIARSVKLTFIAINLQRFRCLVNERTVVRHIGLTSGN